MIYFYKNIMDTIIAISTPYGRSGIGVLRISGLLTKNIANKILNKLPEPRKAEYSTFYNLNKKVVDKGIALFFPKPNSFTGEDILELHGHGNPVILELLIKHILSISSNIRIANPGEFSQRAFLNGKIDLTQAEAIIDLINANSIRAINSAINSLNGIYSKYINNLLNNIIKLRSYIESEIDFPDENSLNTFNETIKFNLNKIICNITYIINEANNNSFNEHTKIVLVGEPNVGKSSLLNALIGYDLAIVSSIKGTTRDILHENINLNNMLVTIIDTAGLCKSNDYLENISIKKTWNVIEKANHILLVLDHLSNILDPLNFTKLEKNIIQFLPKNIPITLIQNKADLLKKEINIKKINNYSIITVSAIFKKGINLIINHLRKYINFNNNENEFLVRKRHLHALEKALIHLKNSKKQLQKKYTIEFLAEELRLSHKLISEITGKINSEDVLNEIFSTFCIGK